MPSDDMAQPDSKVIGVHPARVEEGDCDAQAEVQANGALSVRSNGLSNFPQSDLYPSDSVSNILQPEVYRGHRVFVHKRRTRQFRCKRCDWCTQGPHRAVKADLVRHLRQAHGITKPPSMTAVNTPSTIALSNPTFPSTIGASAALEQAICNFIVDTLQPFTLVETPSFCRIFETLGVQLPTADSIRDHILRDLERCRTSLREELDSTCVSISLSIGTLPRSNDTWLVVVSGCWITPDFEYRERLLDVCELSASYTMKELTMFVPATLKALNIEQKVLAVTSVTSPEDVFPMLSGIQQPELSSDASHSTPSLAPSKTWPGLPKQIRCISWVLNSIIEQIIVGSQLQSQNTRNDESGDGVQQADSTNPIVNVNFFALFKSGKDNFWQDWKTLTDKMTTALMEPLPENFYQLLGETIRSKDAIIQLSNDHPEETKKLALSESDWLFLTQLHRVLRPFDDLAQSLTPPQPTTVSSSFAVYAKLARLQDKVSRREGTYSTCHAAITKAVEAALLKFEHHFAWYDENNILYFVTAILDPRIKGQYLKHHYRDGHAVLARVQQFVREHYPQEKPVKQWNSADPAMPLIARMLRRVHGDRPPLSEIERYFDSALCPWDGRDEPGWVLKWWRRNADQYPMLGRVARDCLAVPAAEVHPGRLFGSGMDIVDVRNSSLPVETLRPLVLLRSQLRLAMAE